MSACCLNDSLNRLLSHEDLDKASAIAVAHALADPQVSSDEKKAVLRALAKKGESPAEVAAFAEVFRGLSSDPGLGDASNAIDIVGTGGDKVGSFNISTTSSLILAAAGVPVIKHGNRSITSKCGSADFLEALGIALEPSRAQLQDAFAELNFVFLFAPAYHPAFKEVVPVRKALAAEGQRTIFNLLGPLINPGRPGRLLMGVFAPQWVAPIAASLSQLEMPSAVVVNSSVGQDLYMDELSCVGPNTVAGTGAMAGIRSPLTAESVSLSSCTLEDLKGGDRTANLQILQDLMAGNAPTGLRDTVCLNAGLALQVAGQADTLIEGIQRAQTVLTDGSLKSWLQRAQAFFKV